MVSLKYTITPQDYTAYYLYLKWDAPDRKKTRLKYFARQVLANTGIVLLIFYSRLFQHNSFILIIYISVLTIITILQILNGRINARKQAEKIASDEENKSFFLETSYIVSTTGIAKKNDTIEAMYQWQAFIRKEETADYYFLFTNGVQAIIFPKRVFKSTEEKQLFEKFLSQHLSIDAELGHWVNQ